MNIFSYIKTKINIMDVISEYTNLKKIGNYWKGHCPFHNEKTASFTVSPHKEIFYCFGCHTGGDVITFIAKMESCTPVEAINHIAERYQIELPKELKNKIVCDSHNKEKYFNICKIAAQWCHGYLIKSPHIIKYLQKRGLSTQIIEVFQIGYFPPGSQSIKSLISHFSKHSFLKDDLIEANIISQGQNTLYCPFGERIIFPIKDAIGRFCGFGGRIFKENDQRAKYYNSHENAYFNKGSLLFGFNQAKKSIKTKNHMFLVEGYMDCIAMHQHGFKNTVATLGTSCTIEHLKTLSRYVHQLYVMYDGDSAGQKAIMRLTDLCWQVNLELKVISLPKNEDPDSFLTKGGDLKPIIKSAQEILIFFIETTGKGFMSKPLNQKLNLARNIIKIINNLQDPITKDILLQRTSKILDIPIEAIKKELKNNFDNIKPNLKNDTKIPNPGQKLEKKIFFAIINDMELLNKDNEDFLINHLPDPLNKILLKLKIEKDKAQSLDFVTFFENLNENEGKYISRLLLEFDDNVEKTTFDQLFLQFQKRNWKYIVQNIKTKLFHAKKESNENEITNILNDFSKLKKKLLN